MFCRLHVVRVVKRDVTDRERDRIKPRAENILSPAAPARNDTPVVTITTIIIIIIRHVGVSRITRERISRRAEQPGRTDVYEMSHAAVRGFRISSIFVRSRTRVNSAAPDMARQRRNSGTRRVRVTSAHSFVCVFFSFPSPSPLPIFFPPVRETALRRS